MNLFYWFCYSTGITPWERVATHHLAVAQIMALFDREERERQPPYGKALDLGRGTGHWSIELASRGWQVTGIEIVSADLRKARKRAKNKAVDVNFIHADATRLSASGLGSDFKLVWDFGMVHCFVLESGHSEGQHQCPLSANSRRCHVDGIRMGRTGARGNRGVCPKKGPRLPVANLTCRSASMA